MATKLVAARTAVAAGIECILTHGAKPNKVVWTFSPAFEAVVSRINWEI